MTPSKQRILETGVTMFARKGFGNTGLRELADQAGVNLALMALVVGGGSKSAKQISPGE